MPPGPAPTGWSTPIAARYGLVRPLAGRYLAGVCAAVGRATNTDPVLWRVIIAVLTVFGGVGLLVYLLGWLLIPAEGDTASPLEALLGRGRSRTSAPVAVIGAVAALLVLIALIGDGFRTGVFALLLLVGAGALLARNLNRRPPAPADPSAVAGGSGPEGAFGPAGTSAPSTAVPPQPMPPMPPTYRPPFAPHGPYASSSPYAASLGYPTATSEGLLYPGLAGHAPSPVPVTPAPPRRRRPRSRLGRLTLSAAALALGVLALIDMAGAPVPAAGYLALALAVVGAGLVVGAWFGWARPLIALGVALSVALGITTAAAHARNYDQRRSVTWAPASVDELTPPYRLERGRAVLDLSRVDFTDRSLVIDTSVDMGDLRVVLPPNVDVDLEASVDMGGMDLLQGQSAGGFDENRQIKDLGRDGPGGGQLNLRARVDLGHLEVIRL
jgi:phage shock protein PspC (stress-responsive transcriptional regulator)